MASKWAEYNPRCLSFELLSEETGPGQKKIPVGHRTCRDSAEILKYVDIYQAAHEVLVYFMLSRHRPLFLFFLCVDRQLDVASPSVVVVMRTSS